MNIDGGGVRGAWTKMLTPTSINSFPPYKWVSGKQIKFCKRSLDMFLTRSIYSKCINHQAVYVLWTMHYEKKIKPRFLAMSLGKLFVSRTSYIVCWHWTGLYAKVFSSCHKSLCISVHSFKCCFWRDHWSWRDTSENSCLPYWMFTPLKWALSNPFRVLFIITFITCNSE